MQAAPVLPRQRQPLHCCALDPGQWAPHASHKLGLAMSGSHRVRGRIVGCAAPQPCWKGPQLHGTEDRSPRLPALCQGVSWVNRHCQKLSWTSECAPDVPSACLWLPVSEEGPSGCWGERGDPAHSKPWPPSLPPPWEQLALESHLLFLHASSHWELGLSCPGGWEAGGADWRLLRAGLGRH